jgi:hypothetical protein
MTLLSKPAHPAYHLRPNKAVDRLLMLEILRVLRFDGGELPHTYIGLGGPYVEDFRLLSAEFPQMELVCVERDLETHKRQEFHLCSSRMTCLHRTLGDYIATSLPSDRPIAVWADYSDMTRECLAELADMVRKAVPGSLLRVTVRAETPVFSTLRIDRRKYPAAVPPGKRTSFWELQHSHRADMAVDGIVFPEAWFRWENFSPEAYPGLLARMIGAVAEGSCTHPKAFLPLHAVKYSDGTVMLSKTGLLCRQAELARMKALFARHCSYYQTDAEGVDEIDVPALTTKERLYLERVLPSVRGDGTACSQRLDYLIEGDGSELASRRKMQQYEKYYKLYPHFGKIMP